MCRSWCLPLYSQAKYPFFHTSAKPLSPSTVETCFSKVKLSPDWSTAAGWGWPSTSQRSQKCCCAPERSERELAFQRVTNSGSASDMRAGYDQRMIVTETCGPAKYPRG